MKQFTDKDTRMLIDGGYDTATIQYSERDGQRVLIARVGDRELRVRIDGEQYKASVLVGVAPNARLMNLKDGDCFRSLEDAAAAALYGPLE